MATGYLLELTSGVSSRLASVGSIALTATGATNLYTVPAGMTLIVTEVILRITSVSGFAVAATVGVGITPAFTEWLAATAMTGLSSAGSFRLLSNSAAGLVYNTVAAGQTLAINVTVGATATSLVATAEVFGYLI